MNKTLLIFLLSICPVALFAQQTATAAIPDYYVNTDLVYDVTSIPKVGVEKFFTSHNRLKSFQLDLAYQVHYSDQFGIVTSHGDRISVGVYQGPVLRTGYVLYKKTQKKKDWYKYYSPAISFKYLWYGTEQVNTGRRKQDPAFRMQSENCIAVVPQFIIGGKRTYKNFCADFYAGIQVHLKFRDKTITYEQNSQGFPRPDCPYNINVVNFAPAPVFGIKLGYMKWKGVKA